METLIKTINGYISNSDTSVPKIGILVLMAVVFVMIALDLVNDIRLHKKN